MQNDAVKCGNWCPVPVHTVLSTGLLVPVRYVISFIIETKNTEDSPVSLNVHQNMHETLKTHRL